MKASRALAVFLLFAALSIIGCPKRDQGTRPAGGGGGTTTSSSAAAQPDDTAPAARSGGW